MIKRIQQIGLIGGLLLGGLLHAEAQYASYYGNEKIFDISRKEGPLPKYTLAVQPLFLSNGGLKIDVERRLNSPDDWLYFSVSSYYRGKYDGRYDGRYDRKYDGEHDGRYYGWENFNTNFTPVNRFHGYGLEMAYKRYFPRTKAYWSAGLSYTYHNVYYADWVYALFEKDGLIFCEYMETEVKQTFNKLLPNVCVGAMTSLHSRVFLDVYAGIGYSYSFYDKDKKPFNKSVFEYGYRGIRPLGGIRVGVTLGRGK